MTGEQFRTIRQKLGRNAKAFALALGYTGGDDALAVAISRLERGGRAIPPAVARLATMFDRFGIPDDFG
jgi:transcriptional regulator with XRE-family HTH domain